MGSGEQCVMTLGIEMAPVLHADNWDSLTSVSWWLTVTRHANNNDMALNHTVAVAVSSEYFGPGRVGNSSVCLTGQVVQTCGELIGHFTKLTGHFIIQISTIYNTKKKETHSILLIEQTHHLIHYH